jgi:Spy/CpxP family protein refolding chaperone
METRHFKLKVGLIAIITILFAGNYASAQMGKRYGGQQGWGPGSGYDGMCAPAANLNADELKKLDAARTAFFKGTRDLRQSIYQKRLELASELAKQKLDPKKAVALQKEISDLRARLAQKRLAFILQVKKINPGLGMGFMGPGSGMMYHGMMGGDMMMGPRGGYGMGPRGGYGMGPGRMMGPGAGQGTYSKDPRLKAREK